MLAAGFGELAAQLGARERSGAGDPVASVHAVLAAFPAEWLLVFYNAPDRASVEAFLPSAGRGRVLITSQSALWPPGQAVEVPVLDVPVAAGFLVSRTGDPDGQAAVELAEELGGLQGAPRLRSSMIRRRALRPGTRSTVRPKERINIHGLATSQMPSSAADRAFSTAE